MPFMTACDHKNLTKTLLRKVNFVHSKSGFICFFSNFWAILGSKSKKNQSRAKQLVFSLESYKDD